MPMTMLDFLTLVASGPQAFSAAQWDDDTDAGSASPEALRRLSNLIDTAQRNNWVQANVNWTPGPPRVLHTAYVLGLTAAGRHQLAQWQDSPP